MLSGNTNSISVFAMAFATEQTQPIPEPNYAEMHSSMWPSLNVATTGPEHWAELHSKSRPTLQWLQSWVDRIPNFGCGCSKNFAPILARFMPQIAWVLSTDGVDLDAWFAITVDIHNAVNIELKRDTMTIDDARKRWEPAFKWSNVKGQRVGFIAIDFMRIGGTETFGQTLVPRIQNAIGFAVENTLEGDVDTLGVPTYQGREAIRSLCNESDVVVSWLVNPRMYGFQGKVIMIHHGSVSDEGQTEACLVGDEIVCVSELTADHLRTITDRPVHYIPNAVDPHRLSPRNKIETDRGKSICLWSHRFSKDKRPELAIEIAKCLPDDWHMIMTGHRNEALSVYFNSRMTVLPPAHPGDWLAVASCFLSTSLFDGFGLSVAEAICAGVPVVSSPAGIATEPGLATIVPHDSEPEVWAKAIVEASEKATRSQLPAEYSLESHVAKWARILS